MIKNEWNVIRMYDVIKLRELQKLTFKDMGKIYNISSSTMHQRYLKSCRIIKDENSQWNQMIKFKTNYTGLFLLESLNNIIHE